ncbi:MAG: hypothetical protein LBG80_02130 [Bacteroidales bacterium]|jgi:hypothetical protein|nr:hypothetical protein [Bacteroidales bacterium]
MKILISAICVLFIQSSWAQNSLHSLIEECSKTGYVRKISTNYTYIISIENNKLLLNKFIKSFEKERKSALYTAQKREENGKIISEIHLFKEEGKFISYAYDITDDRNARITYSQKNAYYLICLFDNIKDRLNKEGLDSFGNETDIINKLKKEEINYSDTVQKKNIPLSTSLKSVFWLIPKNGYVRVNSEKLTAKQAIEKGLNVEEY